MNESFNFITGVMGLVWVFVLAAAALAVFVLAMAVLPLIIK